MPKDHNKEAIYTGQSSKHVIFKKNPEPIPEKLLQAFEQDPVFKKHFTH